MFPETPCGCFPTADDLRSQCAFLCAFSACIGAQDPYCGWDVVMKKCTSLEESLSMTQWEQSISTCPVCACPVQPLKVLLTGGRPTGVAFPIHCCKPKAKLCFLNLFCSWLAGGPHRVLSPALH